MRIGTLIKFNQLKKEHQFNDNLARIILHLGACDIDSFRSMVDLNVIPKQTRCFKDLAVNLKTFVTTWREGCHLTTIRHNAKLTAHGKEIYRLLRDI